MIRATSTRKTATVPTTLPSARPARTQGLQPTGKGSGSPRSWRAGHETQDVLRSRRRTPGPETSSEQIRGDFAPLELPHIGMSECS